MALELTTRARLLSLQTKVEPQIILKIKGIDLIFGAVEVTSAIKYGAEDVKYGDAGIFYGGVIVDANSRDFISVKGGTTKTITQQLLQDKGGTSSVSSMNIELINKDNQLSSLFIPGLNITDLLSRDAEVFVTFQGSSFPEDAIKIFSGIIGAADYGTGKIKINVAHPEELKRQEIFNQIQTELTAGVDSVATTIPVISTAGTFGTLDEVTTYIRVNDEVMEVTTVNPTDYVVIRGSLGTTADTHGAGDESSTLYEYITRPLRGALQLMLSGGDTFYDNLEIDNINTTEGIFVQNAITFNTLDLNSDNGVVAGDTVTITGSLISANNVTDVTILSVVQLSSVTYIVVDGINLSTEGSVGAICSFKSKFNTLSDGLGMRPFHVDILEHERLEGIFSTSFPDYRFFFKETIEGKDFIDKEMYFPANLFSIPRKGRASVGFVAPPLSSELTPKINETNITNLKSVSISRSIKKDFYNAIVYKFNEQLLEDNFLASEILFSSESTNRITGVKNKPLNIESKGLRRTVATVKIIQRMESRLIDRFKFAAQRISQVQVLYKTGFNLEAGDIVSFATENTKLIDPETGEFMQTKLFEVVNKSLNIVNGKIMLDLLDTNFTLDAKFGVIAPSSIIDAGSSSTQLRLKKSFGTQGFELEVSKWVQLVGLKVTVHNADFTVTGNSIIDSIDATLPETINLETDLGFTPAEGYFLELEEYDDSNADSQALVKNTHCYINPSASVASGASGTVFDVVDASDLSLNAIVKVHNSDFTNDSLDTRISNIAGDTITVEDDLGFTPSAGEIVELIGFQDGSPPYRII